ncbi:MAG: hypothetical protein WC934_02845 [Acidithiobacillus sp.]|jgi:hypothetical protein|uniref:hypothetical protein n=1 Tax=Acidithiobacillus sp. TaxID=1872118 RepID=UPI00355EE3C9
MKIKQCELLIEYIKTHYPDLVDKFEIWHDFEETKDCIELWAIYWGEQWNDTKIYYIHLTFVEPYINNGIFKIKEEKHMYTDLHQQPSSYIEELEGIVQSIVNCDDGGDIKYIVDDAKNILKKKHKKKLNINK